MIIGNYLFNIEPGDDIECWPDVRPLEPFLRNALHPTNSIFIAEGLIDLNPALIIIFIDRNLFHFLGDEQVVD
jgi:hypothetical protein